MSVGQKLKSLRGEKPQSEIADALGISKSALSMYENDARVPRDEIKVRIANYFNESVDTIFYASTVHETCTVR